MKKYICTLIIMICSLAFCCPAAFAGKIDLIDSAGEREEIGEAAEDIAQAVNSSGARSMIPRDITENDIDFSQLYRVYSNSEIFKEKAEENSEITGLLKESHYIWQLPLYIDGTSVQVDISRSADSGQWHSGAIYVYENEYVNYEDNIEASLQNAGLDPKEYAWEYVSGLPGIRYPVAIVFDEQRARFIIPAENSSSHTFIGDWETVSAGNTSSGKMPGEESVPTGDIFPVYHFNDVSAASRHLPIFSSEFGIEPYKPNYIIFAIIFIIVYIVIRKLLSGSRKKCRLFFLTFICFVTLFSFTAFAEKRDLIDTSDERTEIENLTEDIVWEVNNCGSLSDLPRSITEEDVDIDKAYKIYSSSDIFSAKTDSTSEIKQILNESYSSWQIPIFIEGNTVLSNFSKVTHIDDDLPEDVKERLEEKLDEWSPSSVSTYKNEIVDLVSNVETSLRDAGLTPENYTYEFVSGIPGIRYPVAIVFDEEKALYVIPAKEATARVFEGDWETVHETNAATPSNAQPAFYNFTGDGFPVYNFDDVSLASRHSKSLGLGGVGLKPYKANMAFHLLSGLAVLALLFCAVRTIRRRRIS